MRRNLDNGNYQGYYRLAESYRNEYDRICHRTLLNIGFTHLPPDQLNAIKDLLNNRLNRQESLFEEQDSEVVNFRIS